VSRKRRPLETAPRKAIPERDTESPSHQRAPFSDPVPGDPTAPGAPHEPGGVDYRQSEVNTTPTHHADTPDSEEKGRIAP
jgi:hypothetical protein